MSCCVNTVLLRRARRARHGRARRRRRLARGAHRPAGAALRSRSLLVAPLAIPAFVSSYGWASAIPSIQGLWRRPARGHARVLPARLPAGAGDAARARPCARGVGPVARPRTRGRCSAGSSCRSCASPSSAAASSSRCTCSPSTAPSRSSGSTPSRPPSSSPTSRRSPGPTAAALGVVLATLCLVLLVVEAAARGRGRYARVGSGSPQPPEPYAAGARDAARARGARRARCRRRGRAPGQRRALARGIRCRRVSADAAGASCRPSLLAGGGAVGAVLVAFPDGVAVAAGTRAGSSTALEGAYYVASSLPAIIVALALVTVTLRLVPGLYQTLATVIAAYVIIFLPRALVSSARRDRAGARERWKRSARSLGSSPIVARVRVTVPLLRARDRGRRRARRARCGERAHRDAAARAHRHADARDRSSGRPHRRSTTRRPRRTRSCSSCCRSRRSRSCSPSQPEDVPR